MKHQAYGRNTLLANCGHGYMTITEIYKIKNIKKYLSYKTASVATSRSCMHSVSTPLFLEHLKGPPQIRMTASLKCARFHTD